MSDVLRDRYKIKQATQGQPVGRRAVPLAPVSRPEPKLRSHLQRMLVTGGHSWKFGEHQDLFKIKPSLHIAVPERIRNNRVVRRIPQSLAIPIAAVVVLSLLVPIFGAQAQAAGYDLSEAGNILTDTPAALKPKLKYSNQDQTYQFNQNNQQLPGSTGDGMAVGGVTYGASLPANMSTTSGVSLTDQQHKLHISLTPEFSLKTGEQVDGHIVYPMVNNDAQLVYTPKDNGLKEDIVLYSSPGMAAQFSYKLNLPAGLNAKQQADGSIAITDSSNPSVNYVIPAPTVKGSTGIKAGFKLNNNILTVYAFGLNQAHYPLSIDPSFVMSTTSTWQFGANNEDNIDYSNANQIDRPGLSGGGLNTNAGSWGSTNVLPTATSNATSVTYNGYIYEIGGTAPAATTNVDYAPINSNGTIGSWGTTTSLPTSTYEATSVAYNGYVYELGGRDGSANTLATVDYALICTGSNSGTGSCSSTAGTLGSWTATTSLPTANRLATSVAYNGYVYEIGGIGPSATVDYAPINANGTVGSWTATTSLPAATFDATSVAYNGYVYEIGGYTTAGTATVDYAPINANGTVGSWTATTSLLTATYWATSVAYNGYVYEIGGTANGSSDFTTVDYAPINANGTVGSWTATTSLPTATATATSVAYNGYVYEIGGGAGGGGVTTVDYAKVDPVGSTSGYTATTSLPTATYYSSSAAYNGYVYEIGGQTSIATTTVDYAPINTDGTIGTWNSTTALPAGTELATSVAYNGYLYEIGGNASGVVTTVDYAPLNSNGTVGTWNSTTALPAATEYATSVVYNGYLYEIGGFTTTYVSATYYAPINTNGTLGSWTATTSLPTALRQTTSVVNGGYVYIIGGTNGSGVTTVDYSTLNSNGTIGSWTATTSLPTATYEATSVVSNGYVYEIGGSNGSGPITTVDYAPINANGTIGSWTAITSLPTVTEVATSVVYNGYLYEIGGFTGSGTTTVDYAQINNGGPGTTGSYTSTTVLPAATAQANSVAYNGYLYEIGGNTGALATTTVDYAPLSSVGGIGSWTATTSLPTATYAATSVVYNGYLYEIGGFTTTYVSATYYAPINTNGTLGSWTATTSLGAVAAYATSVAYNGYLYEMGGFNGISSIATAAYAPINSNGTLGSWTATTSLPAATSSAGSVAYNGYLYEIGGSTGSVTAATYYAPINTNGTLGSWTATTSLPAATSSAGSVAYNGYLYEIGGSTGSVTAATYYAPINTNGTLGSWTATTSLPAATSSAGSVAYNGYLYEIGGNNNSGSPINTVESAGLQSIPDVAHYSMLLKTDVNTNPTNFYLTDTLESAASNVGVSYATATSGSPGFGSLTNASSSVISGTKYPVTISGDGVAYYRFFITIDDTQSAVFGGGTPSSIQYFKLGYHPGTSMRLRGGMTFNGNSLQSLDTP